MPIAVTNPTAALQLVKSWAAVAAGIAVIAVLSDDEGTVLCPFRRTTAGYCPLCGCTRAAGLLLKGDVAASWQRHPLVLLLAIQIPLVFWLRRPRRSFQKFQVQGLLLANLGLAMVIWPLRMLTGDIPVPSGLFWPL